MRISMTLVLDNGDEITTQEMPTDKAAMSLIAHAVSQLMPEGALPPPEAELRTDDSDTFAAALVTAFIHLTHCALQGRPAPDDPAAPLN